MKRHLAEIIAEREMPNAVTVDAVMRMRPCYTRAHIVQLFAGRESLTPDDIVGLPIPAQDRLWVLLRMAQREVWLPAIWACADRAIRHASRSLYRHGRVTEAARLDSVPPIADRASAKAAADAAADAAAADAAHYAADAAADAAYAARYAADAADAAAAAAAAADAAHYAAYAARDAAYAARYDAAAAADEREMTVRHVATLIAEGQSR